MHEKKNFSCESSLDNGQQFSIHLTQHIHALPLSYYIPSENKKDLWPIGHEQKDNTEVVKGVEKYIFEFLIKGFVAITLYCILRRNDQNHDMPIVIL